MAGFTPVIFLHVKCVLSFSKNTSLYFKNGTETVLLYSWEDAKKL